MAHIFRDRGALGNSKRHSMRFSTPRNSTSNRDPNPNPNPTHQHLPCPFGDLGRPISDTELRETAYEIFVGSCRATGAKPLTYISQSEKNNSTSTAAVVAPSLQRSLSSTASKVKKALGLKASKGKEGSSMSPGRVPAKKASTIGELMRIQMRVSEQSDTRIRRALLRISAGQLGRRFDSIVLPLELLQQFKSFDFQNQHEYETWQRRNLKVLEEGLLLNPYVLLDKSDPSSQRLRQIINGASEKLIDTGKNNEQMQVLRTTVMSLACRSFDGSVSDTCHWADGLPLNLHLYQVLLEACFDPHDETLIIEEVDEALELIKKTWVVLGINQVLHNLCFSWVLFHRYIVTGEVESDLLFATNNLMVDIEKDAKETKDSGYSKILSSTLSSILSWAEKKLLNYHETFNSDNMGSLESIVSIAVTAAKILVEDISHEYRTKKKETDVAHERIDSYIRSSMQKAFTQKMDKWGRQLVRNGKDPLPILSSLAQDTTELAYNEKRIFSPVLKKWHPLAAGVAVATLHACYGNELKQFISGISELTPDAVEVLTSADKLEKDLVLIAVEDSVDSDDGGKGIIREMPPYEAEAIVTDLVKTWIKTRVDRLKEWVDRNLQQEVWNPKANKERFAPSAVEVLRIVDETIEVFFSLQVSVHYVLLPDLISGLDKCLQHYISKAKSGCGTRSTFLPTIPALTRCTRGSKFFKKDKPQLPQRRKPQVSNTNGTNDAFGIPQLCVRTNTLQRIKTELDVLEKRILNHLRNSKSTRADDMANGLPKKFDLSSSACQEGIYQLSEATANKVIFHELTHILWDGLYVGETSSSRIEPFLQELEQNLEAISTSVHDRVRTRVITEIMKASFDGFLLVLLAGGPSRTFTRQDYEIIEEDFKFLTELFWSNGDGLPDDLIAKHSTTVKAILPLFHADSETLIEQFRRVMLQSYGSSTKSSRLPMPPTSGQWNPTEPNTLLRVLCHRNDEMVIKFLKKNYNLPKKL